MLRNTAHSYGVLARALHWRMALLGAHIAAALKHHFLDRDDVLRRMTVGGARRS